MIQTDRNETHLCANIDDSDSDAEEEGNDVEHE